MPSVPTSEYEEFLMNTRISTRRSLRQSMVLSSMLAASAGAPAAVTSFSLDSYSHIATFALPAVTASEASAVTYNWDTGTLFVLGDEGEFLVEVATTSGAQLSVMSLTGFDDTEGLTYVGGNQFVITEERLQNAYLLGYSSGGSVNRAALQSADLGPTVGNIGIEGVSYDPRDGSFVTLKEKDPQQVNGNVLSFGSPGTASISPLFAPGALGLIDLSDVQVLATMQGLSGTPDHDNLLILSQETRRILEVDRAGNIQSYFDLGMLSGNAEGLTVDPLTGTLYIVAETSFALGNVSTLFVLTPTPVPVPPAMWMLGSGIIAAWKFRRRQN